MLFVTIGVDLKVPSVKKLVEKISAISEFFWKNTFKAKDIILGHYNYKICEKLDVNTYQKWAQDIKRDEVRESQDTPAGACVLVAALLFVVVLIALHFGVGRHSHHDVLPRFTWNIHIN